MKTSTAKVTGPNMADPAAEFETEPVPASRRRSLLSVTSVWAGFPLVVTGSVSGAVIVHGLGFTTGMLAILLGSLLLFVYVGALSVLAARTGKNFSLQASATFGRRGYIISSALLATLVLGWFSVQAALVGETLGNEFQVTPALISILAGLGFTGLTFLGIRAIAVIGAISGPLFLLFGIIAVLTASTNGVNVFDYKGAETGSTILFGAAVTLVFALFADSGTMTADFTRWAKTPRHALIATASAFPVAHFITLLFGGLVAAATMQLDSSIFGSVVALDGIFPAVAAILIVINIASGCTHCLYNAAVGWSYILKGRMRLVTLALGVCGTIIAALGIWGYFVEWLNLLGIIVPPIGAIIITDQLLMRRAVSVTKSIRWPPFAAWAIGSSAALVTHFVAPALSNVVVGLAVSSLTYIVIVSVNAVMVRSATAATLKRLRRARSYGSVSDSI
jgi:cytosine permease